MSLMEWSLKLSSTEFVLHLHATLLELDTTLQVSLTGAEKRQSLFPSTCWQLNFANVVGFLCYKDKLQIHVPLVVYQDLPCPLVQCCFPPSCYPACLVAWLMLFLAQDFAFTFEGLLSGHFISLLSLSLPALHTLCLLRAHFVSSLLKPLNSIYLICYHSKTAFTCVFSALFANCITLL